MDKYIGRLSGTQDRFFPPITPKLYQVSADAGETAAHIRLSKSGSQSQTNARAVLDLANRPLTCLQRGTGRGLDAQGRLGRLLWLHQQALDEELNGSWTRADFYWREIVRTLKRMPSQAEVWVQLNERFGFSGDTDLGQHAGLYDWVMTELFIDTLCALINGYLKQTETIEPGNRALVYAERLRELLPLSNLPENDRWVLADTLVELQVNVYQAQKQYPAAISLCREMTRNFPDRWKYQDLIVEFETIRALNDMRNREGPASNLADARRLLVAHKNLASLLESYPYNPRIYDTLGLVAQLRAVKLANGDELSDALLEIERSLVYAPHVYEAAQLRDQLWQQMGQLQDRIDDLERQIAQRPGAVLNAEGERFRKQAKEGGQSAKGFLRSERAAELKQAVRLAEAVRFWQVAGLGGADEEIADSALQLYESLESLFADAPDSSTSLRNRLETLTKDMSAIDGTMRESLGDYLESQLFPDESPQVRQSEQPVGTVPMLTTPKAPVSIRHEPVALWLLSSEGWGTKALTAMTLAALMVSTAMAGWDWHLRVQRNQSYGQLRQAVAANDDQAMLNAAKDFLYATSVKRDARRDQVEGLQEQARTRIIRTQTDAAYQALIKAARDNDVEQVLRLIERFEVLTVDTPHDPRLVHVHQLKAQATQIVERAQRDQVYLRLTSAVSRHDLDAVIDTADAFLALPQTHKHDRRTEQVKKVRQHAQELPNKWARDDAYSDLLVAIDEDRPDAVMKAAEEFLSARPLTVKDDRRAHVIDAYSNAFVSWFIAVDNPNDPAVQEHITRYRKLVAVEEEGAKS